MKSLFVISVVSILLIISQPSAVSGVIATPSPTSEATKPAIPAADEAKNTILDLRGAITNIHDPVMIKAGDTYYIFSTGQGIPIHCSKDKLVWELCGRIFDFNPDWAQIAIPGVDALWAPDISFLEGKYHLYYAASTFGSNHSTIGLVTNTTLDAKDPANKWVDEGEVFTSQKSDDFNAIDPNLAFDQDGSAWLAFGSFWGGIKMRKIDPATGKLAADNQTLYSLARRPSPDAIEGAFITRRGNYYYLFVSFDFCCRGISSTYKIMVGRSTKITGPYVDREGKAMMDGGGTLIYGGSERWRGPGHNAIFVEGDIYWLVYHAYDANNNGIPTLRIEALQWDDADWPYSLSARLGL